MNILLDRLKHHYKNKGFFSIFYSMLQRIWRALFYNKDVLFYRDISTIDESDVPLPPNITVRHFSKIEEIPQKDLLWLYKIRGGQLLVQNLLNHFFQIKATLWFVYLDDKVVGWRCSKTQEIGFFKHFFQHFPLTPKDAVCGAAEIFPEYRGRGINPTMLKLMFLEMKKSGINRIYLVIKEWNHANIKSVQKADFKKIGIAKEINILGKKIIIWYNS